ncbi:MAG: anaerobic ribonucleoside-triphosphate reductase [Betaproteobacteria bacterium]|nr:anaerobic ribonucleoside-triphosphate reductase [Betaproteobacteria bacterium]
MDQREKLMEKTIELAADERQKCEVWTRVMGYHRPVDSFNIGKKSEHRERKHFVEAKVWRCGERQVTCTSMQGRRGD